jgi:hypothetical protein
MISDRTKTLIMVLTRVHDVDPDLAHEVRVAVQRGVSVAHATRIIGLLRELHSANPTQHNHTRP